MRIRRIRIKRRKALSNQKSEEVAATVRAKQCNPIESKKRNNRICSFGENLDDGALGIGANLFDRRRRRKSFKRESRGTPPPCGGGGSSGESETIRMNGDADRRSLVEKRR
ncbi:hypothetical protein HKD37_17G047678 [Glycine soja]|nr:hypothetical protein GYH30_047273 [Glycine max]KAH1202253.1 hypothetical protein GmHk_17G048760 [Glycine max]